MRERIGIDLGGTKIEGVLLDAKGGVAERHRIPTPRERYQDVIDAVRDLVGVLDRAAGSPGLPVGVGMPGSVSTLTGGVKNCNLTTLNGRPFRGDLGRALGREVVVANDADCFALSEAVDGAGADAHRVFGVILGTGVGGGIVEGKRLLAGPNGLCGEWGHNLLPQEAQGLPPAPRACFCGRNNCNERFLSAPGLVRTHAALHGETAEARTITRRAEAGDAAARRTLDVYVAQLAFALSQVVNLIDPDVVVLGGGVSNALRLYRAEDGVPAHWGRFVFSDSVETRLARARYGDSSGVRGAAWLT